MNIPNIIHRIWLDDPMPRTFENYKEEWEYTHPDWEIVEWRNSNDLPPMINQELFDRAAEITHKDWKRFQADLMRLELLYRYGGLYVDTDVCPNRNLEKLIKQRRVFLGYSPQHINGIHPITNCVMGAAPEDPFIEECIHRLPDAVDANHGKHLPQMIGPWHITRVYNSRKWSHVNPLNHQKMFGGYWLRHDWNNRARKEGRGAQ